MARGPIKSCGSHQIVLSHCCLVGFFLVAKRQVKCTQALETMPLEVHSLAYQCCPLFYTKQSTNDSENVNNVQKIPFVQ